MGKNGKNKFNYRVNQQIRTSQVRVVGDDFERSGEILSIQEALRISDDLGVDLVEINYATNPPVCKLIEYNKFLYELKKKEKEKNKKQKENAQEVKELRFGPNTDGHDFDFKLKHAEEFLKRGDIVKAFVFFKGREIQFKEKGEELLLKLIKELSNIGTPDSCNLKLEGNRMIVMIKPKKKG